MRGTVILDSYENQFIIVHENRLLQTYWFLDYIGAMLASWFLLLQESSGKHWNRKDACNLLTLNMKATENLWKNKYP